MAAEITKEAQREPQDQAQRIGQRIGGDQGRRNRRGAARASAGTFRGRSGVSVSGSTGRPWNLFCQGGHGRI